MVLEKGNLVCTVVASTLWRYSGGGWSHWLLILCTLWIILQRSAFVLCQNHTQSQHVVVVAGLKWLCARSLTVVCTYDTAFSFESKFHARTNMAFSWRLVSNVEYIPSALRVWTYTRGQHGLKKIKIKNCHNYVEYWYGGILVMTDLDGWVFWRWLISVTAVCSFVNPTSVFIFKSKFHAASA